MCVIYPQAIGINSNDHMFFSNRSVAYLSKRDGESALRDAEECVRLNGSFALGYGLKGTALQFLSRYDDAFAAYQEGECYPGCV